MTVRICDVWTVWGRAAAARAGSARSDGRRAARARPHRAACVLAQRGAAAGPSAPSRSCSARSPRRLAARGTSQFVTAAVAAACASWLQITRRHDGPRRGLLGRRPPLCPVQHMFVAWKNCCNGTHRSCGKRSTEVQVFSERLGSFANNGGGWSCGHVQG